MQSSGSEIFVIETVLCVDNVAVAVLMIYGVKQQWRWVLDPPEWAAFIYLPALWLERWPHLFGQSFLIHKWCLANMAYTAVGSAGRLSKYTPSGV